jgi:hypothetical protein
MTNWNEPLVRNNHAVLPMYTVSPTDDETIIGNLQQAATHIQDYLRGDMILPASAQHGTCTEFVAPLLILHDESDISKNQISSNLTKPVFFLNRMRSAREA